MYKPADSYYKEFVTTSPSTGAAANADSLPTATANHNGTDDGTFTLTVTNIDTGRYKITGTVPAYSSGDVVNVSIAATCSSVAGKAIVDTFTIDTKRVGDLHDSSYNGGAVASVTAGVTVATNNDKAGYSLATAPPTAATIATAIWTDTTAGDFTTAGSPGKAVMTSGVPVSGTVTVGTNNDKTGYSLGASQTFSTTGSVGSVTGAVGSVTGNVTVGGYASGQDPATLVLDVAASSHNTANSIGAKVNSAGSAGDPWSTTLPGSYSAGQAGYVVGHNLDTNVGSRSTFAGGAVASVTAPVTVNAINGLAPPTNWSVMTIDASTGGVTVKANNDKAGYSLTSSQTFSTTGSVGSVTGAVGSVIGNVTVGGYASGQDPATLVLDVAASSHNTANSIGAKVNSAGSAGDPWSTTIPGSYAAGTAGAILGGNLDAKVSTRSTFAGGAVASVTSPVTVGANSDKSGYTLTASQTFSTTGSVGNVTGSVGAVNANVTVGGYAAGQDPATLVLDAPAANFHVPNSIGAMFGTQGTGTTGLASDPWASALPGNYPPGTAGAILGGNLDAQVSAIKNKTDGLPTGFPANFEALAVDAATGGVMVLVNQDKSGYGLGPAGLDAIQVENGINARQALSPVLAASAGLVSGAGTGTIMVTGGNTSVTRITATTDKLGNRSAVTLALPPATSGGVTTTASSYFPSAYFPAAYFPIGKATPSA